MHPQESTTNISLSSREQNVPLRTRLQNLLKETQGIQSPTLKQFHDFEGAWNTLSEDMLAQAMILADKMMKLQPESVTRSVRRKTNRTKVRRASYVTNLAIAQVHELLLLWLETRLHRARYTVNYGVIKVQPEADAVSQEEAHLELVATEIHAYHHNINALDKRARQSENARLLRHFKQYGGEATEFKRLQKEFGLAGTAISEHGWILIADDVGDALRFQYYDALLHQYQQLNVSNRWLSAVWLFIFKYTTGFGVKPQRLFYATIVVILAFTGLYLVNSWLFGDAACQQNVWSLNSLLSHFYVAVTNLQGGGTASSCGNGFRLVQSVEIFSGYFILAILSGLVLNKLTETER